MVERLLSNWLSKLDDPNGDVKAKCQTVLELKESIESWSQSPAYPNFIQKLLPVLLRLLDGPTSLSNTSLEHRMRNAMLEILYRLPANSSEAIAPFVVPIFDRMITLIRKENEDNALVCIKIIMDLQRQHGKTLTDRVESFLGLLLDMFELTEQAVHEQLDNSVPTTHTAMPSTPNNNSGQQYSNSPRPGSPTSSASIELAGEASQPLQLTQGMKSFKVVAECPIIVVSIFQTNRSVVPQHVKKFIIAVKTVLMLQAKAQEKAHVEARSQGKILVGVTKEIKNKAAFAEFIHLQVKVLSFLAYLIRSFSQQTQEFIPALPDIVVRVLQDCPKSNVAIRKELLVAIRHIINYNHRTAFLKRLDDLLDERILLGDGLTTHETMRPIAYSMVADLIHHVRFQLTPEHIRRTVRLFTKNLHDPYPQTSFQTMSAKLLLNIAECIGNMPDKRDARYYLMLILDAFGDKFAALNAQYDNAVKLTLQHTRQSSIDAGPENQLPDKDEPPDWDEIDIFNATPIRTSNPRDRPTDPVTDNKFLFKNLIHGLKTIFYPLRSCNPPEIQEEIEKTSVPPNWPDISFGFDAEETQILKKLLREGAQVFKYYSSDQVLQDPQSPAAIESSKEEKEILENFAAVFNHIDTATFHEIFHAELGNLFELILEHSALLHIPQFLLAAEATSQSFTGIVLQFLMDRLEEVGAANERRSDILLRLFKLSFMAVTLFSQQNEQILLPHVTKIVTRSIQLSTTAEKPINYFLLLRSLFRSIGGGRFEHLYKEILPLLEMLLEVLNNLLMSARKPQERDLYVELSLTVPARLSNLLPHLTYLMRPLVVALRASPDLVGQGLRTLELCVDNLTADYLDPIMAPVMDELMAALWDHLKPNPYSHFHAHTTMRILGKLGGRNRKFLVGPPQLSFQPYSDDRSSFDVKLVGSSKERAFPAELGIDLAIAKLWEVPKQPAAVKADPFHKKQAFLLITSQIKIHIGYDTLPEDFAQLVRLQAQDLAEGRFDKGADILVIQDGVRSVQKRNAQQETLKKLLKACMYAACLDRLRDDALALLKDVCRHFTILEVGKAIAAAKRELKPFDVRIGDGRLYISSRVLSDAIAESLASDNALIREAAEQAILTIYESTVMIFGSADKAHKLPFFTHLARTFSHDCHREEYFAKSGGTQGIVILATKINLGDTWMMARQSDFVRALFYVMKDMPQDLPASTRVEASNILEIILRRCNKGVKQSDLEESKNKIIDLCSFLIFELAHMNKHVRAAAQRAFTALAEVIGTELHQLILPVKDRLLVSIYPKPLRALPFAAQIGFIDAITFCLRTGHGILEFNEPLNRLLMESLALTDAEDENLASKPAEYRNAESIVNLRVACIKLLSIAMTCPDFCSPPSPQNTTRARIIAVFFKSLYSRSPEVINAANGALKGVMQMMSKLPKDLLQNGLKPVLMSLQDPKKLTVEGLDGLARLLTLLTNYFKVEIGARLLEHMKIIADPIVLVRASFTLLEQNKQIKIIAAIFNVFHLLPPTASGFMPQLMARVLELEQQLRRTEYSPLREPICKYLDQYPQEAWNYFFDDTSKAKGRLLAQTLANPHSGHLRGYLMSKVDNIVDMLSSLDQGDADKWTVQINIIHCVHSICRYPEADGWLQHNQKLRKALLVTAKELDIKQGHDVLTNDLRLAADQSSRYASETLTAYLGKAPNDLDLLFDMIEMISMEDLKAQPCLFRFIYRHIVCSESVEYRKAVIMRSLDLYASPTSKQTAKTFVLRNLVNPIFAQDFKNEWNRVVTAGRGTTLVDKSLVEILHTRIWKPQAMQELPDDAASQPGLDYTRMEMLQLTALFLKYHHDLLAEIRKELIKFGYAYIKLDDAFNKHAAYVVVSFFIAQYETPVKISTQIYNALLKACQPEGRPLVAQALELLAPVIPKRLGRGDKRIPIYAWYVRKLLSEESGNLQQILNIYNFIIRHPDLFFEAREGLSPTIIQHLPKIATLPNASSDSKKLALNLIDLLLMWEKGTANEKGGQASQSPESRKRAADGSIVHPSPSHIASAPHRMSLVKYLMQFIATLAERYPTKASQYKDPKTASQGSITTDVCKKALSLLASLLSHQQWSDLDLDSMMPKVTEVVLTSEPKPDEKIEVWTTRVVNVLQIVRVLVNVKPDDWVVARTAQLQKLLDKPLRNEHLEIQDGVHGSEDGEQGCLQLKPLLGRIVECCPEEVEDEEGDTDMTDKGFLPWLSKITTEMLSNGNLITSFNILWTLSTRKHSEVDQHIPAVVKALHSKLAKDHIAALNAPLVLPVGPANPNGPDPRELESQKYREQREMEVQKDLMIKAIDMLSARMNQLGDQRHGYLRVLASLAERSNKDDLCLKILDTVSSWIFNDSPDSPLQVKEKAAVLTKMLAFEQRSDPMLLGKFLELVIKIYEDPMVARTELTVRMEHAFLIGTRAQDLDMRNRFLAIFDKSLSRTASLRVKYLLATQNWDSLCDSYWLNQVIQLLSGSIELGAPIQLHHEDFRTQPASSLFGTYSGDPRIGGLMIEDDYEALMASHKRFCLSLGDVRARDVFEPLVQLQHTDSGVAHDIWVAMFPLFWSALTRDEMSDLEKGLVVLLTKDAHWRQVGKRQNYVKTLLESIVRARPRLKFPPHLMKFLARNYNAWYIALRSMEEAAITPLVDTPQVRESNLDALLEMYASLQEDDLFYGTWRRRCQFVETNAAVSYEQHGIWDKAQQMYETAQIKARTGAMPFSQGEYMLWEDHFIICAQKLQQWDILNDFAKHENLNDLLLESTYRRFEDWNGTENREALESIIRSTSDAPTPRRVFFQAFMTLLKLHAKQATPQDFSSICDEAIQLSIRKWHQLPERITNAHIPILQNFQQLVELHDASVICSSLAGTNQTNLDIKSQELKLLLQSWRERLPNFWDDINAWQDLVTWRQHIFHLINSTYLSLLPPQQTNNSNNSFAYRGYHEIAWIINRFAHVARKHNLPEVCISQLSRIYTLPNIEIQEAFLKLREQAKCHYQNKNELNNGLDVINNTNLNYFGQQQKAEFFTLKGMFLAKLDHDSEASDAFGTALYYDIKLAKAWAEWGQYSDKKFKDDPNDYGAAAAAMSCYLEAAGQYKNAKSRKLLSRILWLLSLDNQEGMIAKAFEDFKGETPVWYWITFIPQLLLSLSRPEARLARVLLIKLAKTYPQALYYQLRTTNEDMHAIKIQEAKKREAARVRDAQHGAGLSQTSPFRNQHASPEVKAQSTPRPAVDGEAARTDATPKQEPGNAAQPAGQPIQEQEGQGAQQQQDLNAPRKPWEYTAEIMASLKTAFPLLALSMETIADQIQKHFKAQAEEDAYRLIVALLNDAFGYVNRLPNNLDPSAKLPQGTEQNISKFGESVLPQQLRKPFEDDFIRKAPTMHEYIQKLRLWRDRFEEKLDRRMQTSNLEAYSQNLSEFRFQKFDEVEVPGQYLHHRDKNQDFIRIERFFPDVDLVRGTGQCYRRLKIRGHDGSMHPFQIQTPSTRHSRREERILQLFRIFNGVLAKRKEARRRNLNFHLPVIVPLCPKMRMVQDDSSYITLQNIYEDYCRKNGLSKDDAVLFATEKLRAVNPQNLAEAHATRFEAFRAIQERFCPEDVLLNYTNSIFPSYSDHFLFRRQFSYQLAALTFMTYTMHMSTRTPAKLVLARATGNIWGTELIPSMTNTQPRYYNPEPVPFRLSPNLQTLMGPLFMEGIFGAAIMAIARCLTEPESELEQQLSIFIRDEMHFWFTQQHRSSNAFGALRESVQVNSDFIVKKAMSLATPPPGNLPANQTVIDLIARATDPEKLAQCDPLWMPYL